VRKKNLGTKKRHKDFGMKMKEFSSTSDGSSSLITSVVASSVAVAVAATTT
jgi:hypothetical protein